MRKKDVSLHLENVAVVDGSKERRANFCACTASVFKLLQPCSLTPSQTLHGDSEHVTVRITGVREVSVQRVGIWAAFQIAFFLFFLLVHTVAALKKCV